jgi:hypothetical protein
MRNVAGPARFSASCQAHHHPATLLIDAAHRALRTRVAQVRMEHVQHRISLYLTSLYVPDEWSGPAMQGVC